MKRPLMRFIAGCALFLYAYAATAQPLHQPIPNYTNDAPYNRPGHGSVAVATPYAGYMENTIGGIVANGSVHYLVQNVMENATHGEILLEKKDASNGTLIANTKINVGIHRGLPASQDMARGLLLDPALNRAYICGSTGSDAFILCYDMTNLTLVTTFGNNGVYIFANSEAIGMVLTGVSNNFLVALNQGSNIQLYEYTSTLVSVLSGTITLSTFSCYASPYSLKKAPNGHYFLAGSATPTAGTARPMIWDCIRTSGNYQVANSTNPSVTGVGTGRYHDYDFYVNPSPPNPNGYVFDLVAVGNTPGSSTSQGIYARYIINTAPNFYTPDASYKNQASLPGLATPVNTSAGTIRFTRCAFGANGYVTVLGYYNSTNSDRGIVGYLTPSGTQYYTTYAEPSPSNPDAWKRLHKMAGFARDGSGNILISGCTMSASHTITKLSDSYDCRPAFNLKGSTTLICRGNSAGLNINVVPSNAIITWRSISPVVSHLYTGIPIALLVTPTVTTTYEVTVTNPATGCQSVATITVQVMNDPTFSLSINTGNPNYFTLSALANDQLGSNPGFGYAWFIERLDPINSNVLFTIPNNSCWWIPLTTPTTFSGVDCIANNYSGTVTLPNCNPAIGKFRYGHRYRITRGTWTDDCGWQQQSMIIQPSYLQDPVEMAPLDEHAEAPDFSERVARPAKATGVHLYPNPNHGSFYVSTDATFTGNFEVYDMTGKLISTATRTNDKRQQIDVANLQTGVYYLRAEVDGIAGMYRFVVE